MYLKQDRDRKRIISEALKKTKKLCGLQNKR